MIDLTGKSAIVTGGSRGIGKAIALRLAQQGADICFSYRGNTDAADATTKEIEALGRKCVAVQADVTLPDAAATNTAILPYPGEGWEPRVAWAFVVKTERRPDDHVGGYRIVRLLGRGGSGAVYLVTDEGGGEAALKLVDTSDAGARVRLSREVAALQALRHPAVPRVLDAELDDEDAFVVSEFIDGPSLSQHVRSRGPLPPGQVERR